MNKKNIKIIVIVVACVLALALLSFGIFTVVSKAENSRKERKAKEREIVNNFESFKNSALSFSDQAVEFAWIDITKNTVYQYDTLWIPTLDSMQEHLKEMDEKAPMYKANCIGTTYTNSTVSKMCASFIEAYEEAVNTYVADVLEFNTKINEIKESTKDENLKEYELTYEKIDLNNDKEYSVIEIETGNEE